MGKMFHLNMVEYTSAYYSNSGNLIVPLVTYILGKEWVIYGCVFMSVQLFFIWTHCKCKISGETEISLKKILLNINMISVFAGVFLFFTKIRFPEIIGNTLSSVGSMIGPLSMIVTGMLIAGVDLKKVFTNKRIYLVTFIRLVIEPIIALAVIILLGIKKLAPTGRKHHPDYIHGSDHTMRLNDHTDVSGVRKRFEICKRDQCNDDIAGGGYYAGVCLFLYESVM